MKIAITGGNGYIGQNLTRKLHESGHEVVPIPRRMLYTQPSELADYIKDSHAVINLAGAPIMQRWTTVNKTVIYNSRVLTTRNLCAAINELPNKEKPNVFISTSAVGIYTPLKKHDESSDQFISNFIGRIVMDWESSSLELDKNVRRVIFRTGIVIGKKSQVIKSLRFLFKMGLGAWVGSGNQPFPYVHIDDVVNAYLQAINHDSYEGIFNLVAPEEITNKQFVKKFAEYLNRPAIFSIPPKVLKIAYGEVAEMFHVTPTVVPMHLLENNFSFQYPTIDSALLQIVT